MSCYIYLKVTLVGTPLETVSKDLVLVLVRWYRVHGRVTVNVVRLSSESTPSASRHTSGVGEGVQ